MSSSGNTLGIERLAVHPNGTKLFVPEAVFGPTPSRPINVYDADTGVLLTSITDPSFSFLNGVCLASAQPSALDLLNDLVGFVIDQDFNQGIENPLLDKLNAALNVLENGNINAAINILGDFINLVEKKRGKGISDAQADELIDTAEEIIELLQSA